MRFLISNLKFQDVFTSFFNDNIFINIKENLLFLKNSGIIAGTVS